MLNIKVKLQYGLVSLYSNIRDSEIAIGFIAVEFITFVRRNTVGPRFATVNFTTIHFYVPCRVGPSTPDLWCITVANQASFLCLLRF